MQYLELKKGSAELMILSQGMAVSPDRRRAVSASQDDTPNVWDLETDRELRTLEGHSGVLA